MKQLCYLSNEHAAHRWDAVFAELDIVPTWYDVAKIKSLSAWVAREKTLHQQNFILIDLEGQPWSNEHVLSAVQMLRRLFVGHLIFLSPQSDDAKILYGALANQFRINGLIYEDEETADKLRSYLLNPDIGKFGTVLEAVQAGVVTQATQVVSPLDIPPGLVVTLAVAGAMPRCGTTTQVFALWHYLSGLGFRAAIIDTTGRADGLEDFYAEELTRHDGYMAIRGIPFCVERQEVFNAYIVDAGVVAPNNSILLESDVAVVVGGAKPWELPPLAAALAFLRDKCRYVCALVNLSTDAEVQAIKSYLGVHYAATAYHPDFMAPTAPTVYQQAVLPCLKAVCSGEG